MIISLVKSGGLAGLAGSLKIDTELISEKESKEIREYLNDINFFNLPNKFPFERKGAADYLNYEITIEDGNNKKTVMGNDLSMPSKLRDFISFIGSKYDYEY